nr:MAG TPA_asm: hypothetical protein [Caudoviricetes sp.]
MYINILTYKFTINSLFRPLFTIKVVNARQNTL